MSLSISAVGISRAVVLHHSPSSIIGIPVGGSAKSLPNLSSCGGGGLTIECSSRPTKKATAHHIQTRPKKTQPWDIRRRGPTFYPPLPPLPPDWTLASDETAAAAAAQLASESVANSE